MARPQKTGLDYFPLDLDFFDDIKILHIEERFGSVGILIALKLLAWIYRDGYFREWNDEIAMLFVKKNFTDVKKELVLEVVSELVERSFFDKKLYQDFGILTSKGIQNRWLYIKQSKKHIITINSIYDLVSSNKMEETPEIKEETPEIKEETTLITEFSTQSKVKESKVKKSKETEETIPSEIDDFSLKKTDKIQSLWIRTFGRNPKYVERKETERLVLELGDDKVYQIFKSATLRNIKSLQYVLDNITAEGKLKPFTTAITKFTANTQNVKNEETIKMDYER